MDRQSKKRVLLRAAEMLSEDERNTYSCIAIDDALGQNPYGDYSDLAKDYAHFYEFGGPCRVADFGDEARLARQLALLFYAETL